MSQKQAKEVKPPIEPIKKTVVNKRITPTLRQKRLKDKMMENVSKGEDSNSMGKLMQSVGFSASASENPKRVLQSKGFQYLMKDVSSSIDYQLKEVENRLKEELPHAKYNELSTHFDRLMKWKQVISGNATSIIGTKEIKGMSNDDLMDFIEVEATNIA